MLFDIEFTDRENGFTITNKNGGASITLTFDDYGVSVPTSSHFSYSDYMNLYLRCCDTLIYDKYRQPLKFEKAEKACRAFYEKMYSKNPFYQYDGYQYRYVGKIKQWMVKKCGQAMNKGFVERWHRYMDKCANPLIRQAQKRLVNILGFRHDVDIRELMAIFNKFPYFQKDFFKYNACAYLLCKDIVPLSRYQVLQQSKDLDFNNWMNDFYHCNQYNKNYRKTIMNLPTRLGLNFYWQMIPSGTTDASIDFVNKKMNRPLEKRSEVVFFFLGVQSRTYRSCTNVILQSKHAEIAKVAKFMRGNGFEFSLNSLTKINNLFAYLNDYPETYNGDLMGLARRSLDWHNNHNYYYSSSRQYSPETKLPTPPWGDLEDENIVYLSTVGDLQAESKKMHHCVSSYDSRCIQGHSFIYHVKKDKEKATIEVNPEGRIVQAQGPCNKPNNAAKWGKRRIQSLLKKKEFDIIEPLTQIPF